MDVGGTNFAVGNTRGGGRAPLQPIQVANKVVMPTNDLTTFVSMLIIC